MGDPAGIGPELCLRLLRDAELNRQCRLVVIGDAALLRRVARQLDWPFTAAIVTLPVWQSQGADVTEPIVLDLACLEVEKVLPGQVSALCGQAAYDFFRLAIDEALAGRIDAIATAPLSKESLHSAGYRYPGHTEILAERTHAPRTCMMLTSPLITCSLVTVHVGLREVPALISTPKVLDAIELTADALRRIRQRPPRIFVCGLNPHAGENGLFGDREEERFIIPAIEAARHQGLDVHGPFPPDTAFLPKHRQACDGYICMYHDQGLIPFKTLAFDQGVNVTLGLPIIRTSVDHGTAFDIAWQGLADVASLRHAVQLAIQLAVNAP